jgi:hypothetical protein
VAPKTSQSLLKQLTKLLVFSLPFFLSHPLSSSSSSLFLSSSLSLSPLSPLCPNYSQSNIASNRPIFNIGLADFFEIFDEKKWVDKEALRNLRDALARLNQVQ